MKRAGNLYERISDRENLGLAFHKAARGKRRRSDVILYARHLEENLSALQRELRQRRVRVGEYHYFTIYEPKERLICAASFRERVLHHAIMNVLEPALERFQIYDSYACRKGKGTEAALLRALHFCRRHTYYLKLDVRKYFDSIPHDRLLVLLERRIKDAPLLELLRGILDPYHRLPGRGVPIGNLTSQHLANFYLAHVDHLAKDRLQSPGYIRYMDDMLLFADSHRWLRSVERQLRDFVNHELDLELKPPVTGPVAGGVLFLGFIITPRGIYLSRRKRRLARRRTGHAYGELASGRWSQAELAARLLPIFAHLSLARSRSFRQHLLQRWDHGL